MGWGGILTFMYHAYRRGCYAAATSLVRGWVWWGGFMYHAYIRGCYAAATSLVRGWVGWGGILTFMYHAYTICFMKLAITVSFNRWNVENFQRCSVILLEHT